MNLSASLVSGVAVCDETAASPSKTKATAESNSEVPSLSYFLSSNFCSHGDFVVAEPVLNIAFVTPPRVETQAALGLKARTMSLQQDLHAQVVGHS